MPTLRSTARTAILSLAALAAGGACDPTPNYPPSDPTLPGLIESEVDLVARAGEPLRLVDRKVELTIPEGALPPGTKVHVRLLVSIDKTLAPMAVYPWQDGFGWRAVQILPETLTFAPAATLVAKYFTYELAGAALCVSVLFARPMDPSWQRLSYGTISPPDYYKQTDVTASIDHGGLWSFAYESSCPSDAGAPDAGTDGPAD